MEADNLPDEKSNVKQRLILFVGIVGVAVIAAVVLLVSSMHTPAPQGGEEAPITLEEQAQFMGELTTNTSPEELAEQARFMEDFTQQNESDMSLEEQARVMEAFTARRDQE